MNNDNNDADFRVTAEDLERARHPLSPLGIPDREGPPHFLNCTVVVDVRSDGSTSIEVSGARGRVQRDALFAAALVLVRALGATN